MVTSTKVKVIVASVALSSLLYYLTSLRLYPLQELFTRLYYIPIVLGGIWFGIRGGICVSLLVTMICIPHTYMAVNYDKALFYDEVLELILFNIVGAVVGALKDREMRQLSFKPKASSPRNNRRNSFYRGSRNKKHVDPHKRISQANKRKSSP